MEKTIELKSREDYSNSLRRFASASGKESFTYLLVTSHPSVEVEEDDTGRIIAIEPRGGPKLSLYDLVEEAGATVAYIDYVVGRGYFITLQQ